MSRQNALLEGFRSGFILFKDCIVITFNTLILIPIYFIGVGLTKLLSMLSGQNKKTSMKPKYDAKSYWHLREIDKNQSHSEMRKRSKRQY